MNVLNANENDTGKRLDVFVSEELGISRSLSSALISAGGVTVNGFSCLKNYRVRAGDTVCAAIPEPEPLTALPQNLPVDIVYEDDDLLVVNKPQGMVVHPAAGNPDGTLVNALLYHCAGRLSAINGVVRPGIVHRIDKNTAGLLIVAKTDAAHRGLAEQIADHSFSRQYEAVVVGGLPEESATLSFPIGRNPRDRKKMAVVADGRPAVTHYRVCERFRGYTYTELTLETGRTHQIRVHLAHIGHPVVGDDVYGTARNPFGLHGQCLFARHIGFIHPITGKSLSFDGERPEFLLNTLKKLRKDYSL